MNTSSSQPDNRPVRLLLGPFERFLHLESSGSIVLLLATIAAMAAANSRFEPAYERFLNFPFGIHMGSAAMSWPLHLWVNDALMAIFFLMVGLEVKREFLIGELASFRRALLPVVAALGGLVVPALIYLAFNHSGPGARGWGIPIATDIAFSLAILVSFGNRIPFALRIFLASLAIVDDIGGVLVIAVAYTQELHLGMLALAGGLFILCLVLNRLGVARLSIYLAVGVALWWAMHASGIHATLAGIVLALAIPSRSFLAVDHFVKNGYSRLKQLNKVSQSSTSSARKALGNMKENLELVESPLDRLQAGLHPWVSYGIMPMFAFANAGISLHGFRFASMLQPAFAGVTLGLVLGKPIGITLFSWVAVRLGWAELPREVGWAQLHAVSWLAGIGFTVAIFMAALAFGEGHDYTQSRIAVLMASTCAAGAGSILLAVTGTPVTARRSEDDGA